MNLKNRWRISMAIHYAAIAFALIGTIATFAQGFATLTPGELSTARIVGWAGIILGLALTVIGNLSHPKPPKVGDHE